MYLLRFFIGLFGALAVCGGALAGSFEDFRVAVNNGDTRAVSALVARGFDPNTAYENGNRALHFAALEGNENVVAALVKAPGVDLNARNNVDETPLMLAVIRGHRNTVESLLTGGAQVNKTGWSALHYAASAGNNDLAKLLLGKQAAVDAKSPNGTTPLMMAARHGHLETVKLLLDSGANIAIKNEQSMTARDFAVRHERKDVAQMLAARENKAR